MANHGSLRVLRPIVVSIVFAVMALIIVPFSVSAQTLAPSHSSVSPDPTPVVKIITHAKTYFFKPNHVSVGLGGSITFNNTTGADQTVTYKGKPLFGPILAHSSMTFTVALPAGTYTLSLLSNTKAHLKLTVK